MKNAIMKVTEVAYTDVVLTAPAGQTWPDYVKPPLWARGVPVTIRPDRITFRLFPGRPLRSWILMGSRVLKKGGTGQEFRVGFDRPGGSRPGWHTDEPDWARKAIDEALAELGRS
jgi:hypothetical protein